MNTRPPDLTDGEVTAALQDGWGITPTSIAYAAVGFGSHHWAVTDVSGDRWFLNVDDLDRRPWPADEQLDRLRRAFGIAARLRGDAALDFVVAPTASCHGEVVVPLGAHFGLSVFPHIDGFSHPYGEFPTDGERDAVLRLMSVLHAATPAVADLAIVEDLVLPDRAALDRALADIDSAWDGGPYAEPTRRLVQENLDHLQHALAAYDDFAVAAKRAVDEYVITHGEPHASNVIFTSDGPHLIDWDTAKLAPPERDLARIVGTDIDDTAAYDGPVNLDRLTMYGLWWDLAEICLYAAEFRRPHIQTADTEVSFEGLTYYVQLGEHWPGLLD